MNYKKPVNQTGFFIYNVSWNFRLDFTAIELLYE